MNAAQQLAAHPKFRWMAGMLTAPDPFDGAVVRAWLTPARPVVASIPPNALANGICEHGESDWTIDVGDVPDLADPPTGGCLLAQLWAWRPDLHVHYTAGVVSIHDEAGETVAEAHTVGEACALALLASWGPA